VRLANAALSAYVFAIDIWPDHVAVAQWRTIRTLPNIDNSRSARNSCGLEHLCTD